jgi:hypothetical protein
VAQHLRSFNEPGGQRIGGLTFRPEP